MTDSSEFSRRLDDMSAVELTGKIMVVALIVLFLVVAFVFFLHLYARWFLYRREEDAAQGLPARRRRRRFDFAPGNHESTGTAGLRRGLDPSVLKSIPVVVFRPKEFKDGLECAVCLSDVSDGEKARLLPKCNHGFHVDCIDMWFQSHSTCPLCRNPVSPQSSYISAAPDSSSPDTMLHSPPSEDNSAASASNGYSTESPNFPTNVLFWGNQTQVSTLGSCLEEGHPIPASSQVPNSSSSSSSSSTSDRPEGMLIIDIPRQMTDDEEPKSPVTTRLRSLKRLLSRGRRVAPCSPGNVDVEQVGRVQN